MRSHTLVHTSTLPRVWPDWLFAAGAPDLEPVASLTLDHFYSTLQAALDGLGVAMGPTALVADDLATGRLVAPFPSVTLPSRGYHAYLPDARAGDRSAVSFANGCRKPEERKPWERLTRQFGCEWQLRPSPVS